MILNVVTNATSNSVAANTQMTVDEKQEIIDRYEGDFKIVYETVERNLSYALKMYDELKKHEEEHSEIEFERIDELIILYVAAAEAISKSKQILQKNRSVLQQLPVEGTKSVYIRYCKDHYYKEGYMDPYSEKEDELAARAHGLKIIKTIRLIELICTGAGLIAIPLLSFISIIIYLVSYFK